MPRATQGATLPGFCGADPAALDAALAAFRAHGATAAAMVARLAALLDRLDAVPVADWARWCAGVDLYMALRRGTVPHPIAPHVWAWRCDLRTQQFDAFPLVIRCRAAYLALDQAGRRAAEGRHGRLHAGGQDFSPLWRLGWPQDAVRGLDQRAGAMRADVVPLFGTGQLWSNAGYTDDEGTKQGRRQVKRKELAGVCR